MQKESSARKEDPSLYDEEHEIYKPLIYKQISEAFGLDEDKLDFDTAYRYSDLLISEDYEGLPKRYDWSEEEWDHVLSIQGAKMKKNLSPSGNKLKSSRLFMPIMEHMRNIVEPGSVNQTHLMFDQPYKAIIYSMHDSNLWHILEWMQPTSPVVENVVYTSQFIYELHLIDGEYFVQVLYNSEEVVLDGCSSTMCPFKILGSGSAEL